MDERPMTFDSAETARAGAFVSIDGDGKLHVERGYVRPEDELPVEPEIEPESDVDPVPDATDATAAMPLGGILQAPLAASSPSSPLHGETGAGADDEQIQTGPAASAEPDEGDGIKPLPDRLMAELTTHRTLALRHAIGERPDVAFLAALHALCLKLFYPYTQDTCLELDLKQVAFASQPPGLAESTSAQAIGLRHQGWAEALPREAVDLWDALAAADDATRQRLFAHCVSASVNAVQESWSRRPRALAHAGRLAEAVQLDMAAAGWTSTVDAYLGRVTKARILQAVREARGEQAADRIGHLKKGEMAEQAQDLLAGSGWLPEPLRTPGRIVTAAAPVPDADTRQPTETGPVGGVEPTEDPTEDPTENWQTAAE